MAKLRFGYFIAPFHRAGTNPTLALQRDLEFIEHLDALGFDEVWLGEHHSAGSEIISSPEIFIGAASQRAKRIRFGTGVTSLSYHNPLWVADRLMLLDCRSLEYRTLPLPANTLIVVADTSVRRKLSSGGYNERRAACEEAVRLLARELPGIKALRDVSLADFNRLSHLLPPAVELRARHVVEEIERTRLAIPYLEQGRMDEFGLLMNACHTSLRDLYEVSIPELDQMVEIAQSLPGCFGARLTGAGFGGCTVNLVASDQAGAFAFSLGPEYERRTGLHPEIYICQASQGAGLLA